MAKRLGQQEIENTSQFKFTPKEEGLQKRVEVAGKLLDSVTNELGAQKLIPTEELQKTWDYWKRVFADRQEDAKDKLISPVDPDARMGKKTSKIWLGRENIVC